MFSRTAFISGRTPPVPKPFQQDVFARGKEKEENGKEEDQPSKENQENDVGKGGSSKEKEEIDRREGPEETDESDMGEPQPSRAKEENEKGDGQPLPLSPLPVTLEASRSQRPTTGGIRSRRRSKNVATKGFFQPLDELASLSCLAIRAEEASSGRAQTDDRNRAGAPQVYETEARVGRSNETEGPNQADNISSTVAAKFPFDLVPDPVFTRETLCIRWGEREWNNLAEVTIYPVCDIEHSDEDMIVRVKDLLGPGNSGEDVGVSEQFFAKPNDGMLIIDNETLCAILVTPESPGGTVRVGDFANLKPQTEKFPMGYGELDTLSASLRGSHVMIVKRGQSAVITGRPTLRLFVRVAPGTAKEVANAMADDVWLYSKTVSLWEVPVWHEYFTKRRQ